MMMKLRVADCESSITVRTSMHSATSKFTESKSELIFVAQVLSICTSWFSSYEPKDKELYKWPHGVAVHTKKTQIVTLLSSSTCF